MLRYLRYLVLLAIAVVLIVVSIANRAPVTLQALPPDMAAFLGGTWSVELPLFAVIAGGIVAGLLIGFVWEWVREYKHRATASTKARQVSKLERELAGLRDAKGQPQDDVLAILEAPRKAG